MKITDFNERTQRQIIAYLARQNTPAVRAIPRAEPESAGRGVARSHARQESGAGRVVVSLVSLRRRLVDDDNLSGGCKHLRDAIARSLGLDDGDKRIRFEYSQLQTNAAEGVIVKIEVLPHGHH